MEFDLIPIGVIKKTYGKDGGLKVAFHQDIFDRIIPGTFLFIDLDGNQVPFDVSKLEIKSDTIVYFEGITNPEEANLLTGREISLERENLDSRLIKTLATDELEFSFLTGYALFHPDVGKIGIIQYVEAYPQQEMAVLSSPRDNIILIPLNWALITDINEKDNKVFVNFPVDLINL